MSQLHAHVKAFKSSQHLLIMHLKAMKFIMLRQNKSIDYYCEIPHGDNLKRQFNVLTRL